MTIKQWYKKSCYELRNDPLGEMDWRGSPDWLMFLVNGAFDILMFGFIAYVAVRITRDIDNPVVSFIALAIGAIIAGKFVCAVIDIVKDTILLNLYEKHHVEIHKVKAAQEEAKDKLEALKEGIADEYTVNTETLVGLCEKSIVNYNALGSFLKNPKEVAQKTVEDWTRGKDS